MSTKLDSMKSQMVSKVVQLERSRDTKAEVSPHQLSTLWAQRTSYHKVTSDLSTYILTQEHILTFLSSDTVSMFKMHVSMKLGIAKVYRRLETCLSG